MEREHSYVMCPTCSEWVKTRNLKVKKHIRQQGSDCPGGLSERRRMMTDDERATLGDASLNADPRQVTLTDVMGSLVPSVSSDNANDSEVAGIELNEFILDRWRGRLTKATTDDERESALSRIAVLEGLQRKQRPHTDLLLMVPLACIDEDVNNERPNMDTEEIPALAESIRTRGLLERLRVYQAAVPDRYELESGHRRLAAMRLLGWTSAPCILIATPATTTDIDIRRLLTNVSRKDVDPISKARTLQRLVESGVTQSALAQSLGVSQGEISNSIRLLQLAPPVLEILQRGELSPGHGMELLRVSRDDQERRAMEAVREKKSVKALRKEVTDSVHAIDDEAGVVGQKFSQLSLHERAEEWKANVAAREQKSDSVRTMLSACIRDKIKTPIDVLRLLCLINYPVSSGDGPSDEEQADIARIMSCDEQRLTDLGANIIGRKLFEGIDISGPEYRWGAKWRVDVIDAHLEINKWLRSGGQA